MTVTTPPHVRVVTVSRQLGANGEAIAREVARRLDFGYLDQEVIVRAAGEAGVTPELVEDAEHFPSLKERMLRAIGRSSGMIPFSWYAPAPEAVEALYASERYRALLEQVIREVAHEGHAVILGHGGQVILSDRWDTLRVLVTASIQLRDLRLRDRVPDRDAEEARRQRERSDSERITYFERVHGVEWLSPRLYDLCLNTDRWSVNEAAGIVCGAALAR